MQSLERVSDQVGGKRRWVREVNGELIGVLLDGRIKRVRSDEFSVIEQCKLTATIFLYHLANCIASKMA